MGAISMFIGPDGEFFKEDQADLRHVYNCLEDFWGKWSNILEY